MSINENAKSLLLTYIAGNHDLHIKEAANTGMSCEDFLDELLDRELGYRKENRLKKRISTAKFPYKKYLVDLDRSFYDKKTSRVIEALGSLDFIRNKENLFLIGNPGVGKTHLAIALGIEACMQDMRVLFTSVPNLVIELREAMSLNQITAFRKKFESFDLVILDELGYVSFDKDGNEILFNLLSARNNAGSTIFTTNLVFERWVEVFKDPILTGALVDRISHESYVLDMSGDSYRIRQTIKWLERTMGKFEEEKKDGSISDQ
ncbi:MAG: IS21-like element helper ATPase IstB [Clostridiales Family XIII bacterium]|jgi:DNA replication protein DnaC|nr:IS21-like element helper ATPase IstB [Clostridiales Family XIII bacterium]